MLSWKIRNAKLCVERSPTGEKRAKNCFRTEKATLWNKLAVNFRRIELKCFWPFRFYETPLKHYNCCRLFFYFEHFLFLTFLLRFCPFVSICVGKVMLSGCHFIFKETLWRSCRIYAPRRWTTPGVQSRKIRTTDYNVNYGTKQEWPKDFRVLCCRINSNSSLLLDRQQKG